MYNLCLLAGYTEEYLAENHKQTNQLAREAFPELDRTDAEEVFGVARVLLASDQKFVAPRIPHMCIYNIQNK